MKREKLIIIIILMFLVIIIFLLYRFFSLFSVKDEISSTDKQEIITSYDSFKVNFDKCLNYHHNLTKEDYEYYMTAMNDLYKASETLEKLCDKDYEDAKASSTCLLFRANYEAISNYYISDTLEHKNLSVVKYEDYIDYDKDGKYFGKGDEG